MAKYTATKSVEVYDKVEDVVAGLETQLELIDTGQNHLTMGIEKTASDNWAAWVVYTAEA